MIINIYVTKCRLSGKTNIVPNYCYALESHQPHLRTDPELCGPYEKQPLGEEVCNQHQIIPVWDRFDESVPSYEEVREYEEYCSKGEEAAALKEGRNHHDADYQCIDTYSDAHNACRRSGGYPEEHDAQQGYSAEEHHREISFRLACQLPVRLDLLEISFHEIYYKPYMPDGEESHLPDEVPA